MSSSRVFVYSDFYRVHTPDGCSVVTNIATKSLSGKWFVGDQAKAALEIWPQSMHCSLLNLDELIALEQGALLEEFVQEIMRRTGCSELEIVVPAYASWFWDEHTDSGWGKGCVEVLSMSEYFLHAVNRLKTPVEENRGFMYMDEFGWDIAFQTVNDKEPKLVGISPAIVDPFALAGYPLSRSLVYSNVRCRKPNGSYTKIVDLAELESVTMLSGKDRSLKPKVIEAKLLPVVQKRIKDTGTRSAVANILPELTIREKAALVEGDRRGPSKLLDADQIVLRRRSSLVSVGFVSPFSYGKSTLVNALLGCDLLKDDIRAETACITRVYQSRSYQLTFYQNGRPQVQCFSDYHSLKSSLHQTSSVRGHNEDTQVVYVGLPLRLGPANPLVEWVDTPGIFGRYTSHNQITEDELVNMDIILLLVEPSKVGDANYVDWLDKHIAGRLDDCVFVIGKRDLHVGDIDVMVSELFDSLPIHLRSIPIVSVSGYWALVTRMYQTKQMGFERLQKDLKVYAMHAGERYSGRALRAEHCTLIERASGIHNLELLVNRMVRQKLQGGRHGSQSVQS